MRIERLRIENFRRFKLADVEIADGVTALVGRNGAGKSTVLESIGWALYGNEAARTGKDLLKRRGATPSEDVRVHLAFRLGPHVYEVTRELLGKSESPNATVKVDGKVVVAGGAQSTREATDYLSRAFHMDRDAFFTSLVARQRELAALSDAKPAERKRVLIGLLRLDAVDVAIAEARARRRDARARLSGLRSATLDLAPLRAGIETARATILADRARLVETDAAIVRLVDEVEDARTRRESGRKLAEEHKLLLAQLATLDERLVHVRAERARRTGEITRARAAAAEALLLVPQLEALPAARVRVDTLTARAEQAKMLASVAAELARAEADIALARKDDAAGREAIVAANTLRALAERVGKERSTREAAFREAQKRVADLDAQLREYAKQVNEVGTKEKRIREIGPEAPCPQCTRPLHDHYDGLLFAFRSEGDAIRAALDAHKPELEAARLAEATARKALDDLTARDAEIRAKIIKLSADEARVASAAARLVDATQRAERYRAQAASLAGPAFDPKELDAARAALRALEAARDRHARLAADAEREKEIAPILAELAAQEEAAASARAAAEAARVALGFDAATHAALELAATKAEAALASARIDRERAVGQLALREAEAKRLTEALAQQEALAVQAAALEREVLLLESLAGERDGGLLPEFKDHLIGRIRPLLSLHAGRLFRELCEGRYADLEVDDQYDLLVHDDGRAFPLERFSGGEADLANLCLRLAVSQVVAERSGSDGFQFLALDEIFGSQDEVRKGNILRALQGLSGRFRQILLITHILDVKESAENVLRVEALDDGTSRLVVEG